MNLDATWDAAFLIALRCRLDRQASAMAHLAPAARERARQLACEEAAAIADFAVVERRRRGALQA